MTNIVQVLIYDHIRKKVFILKYFYLISVVYPRYESREQVRIFVTMVTNQRNQKNEEFVGSSGSFGSCSFLHKEIRFC